MARNLEFKQKFSAVYGFAVALVFFFPPLGLALDDSYTKSSLVSAETFDSANTAEMSLVVGELDSIATSNLTRISVTKPEIADIVEAVTGQVDIMGKSPGETVLFIWDDNGKQKIVIHVYEQELKTLKDRADRILNKSGLGEISADIDETEGKVILSGEYPEYKEDMLVLIQDMFGEAIINLTKKEELLDMIQVDMQVVEVSTSLSKDLGFEWGASGGGDLSVVYEETPPAMDGTPADWFKIGEFSRTTFLQNQVNMLVQEGKGRVLSRPKIVVSNGEEAKLLVGGQIPIRTSTASTEGSTVTENVSFKDYGVGMTLTPTIKHGKINIVLNVTISDIDRANSVGDDVAFVSRDASTNLNLDSGQTVVLGGLIKHDEGETVKKVPYLGDIPVLGAIFRSKSIPNNEDIEVIISLTPKIMSSSEPRPSQKGFSENKLLSRNSDGALENKQGTQVFIAPEESLPRTLEMRKQAPVPEGMEGYIKSVQERIAQSVVYPQQAKEQRWEGTVRLAMLILNDGTLAHAAVKESSGHDIIDEYALNTAQNIAPYAGFPPNIDLQEISVTIPIVYSLKNQ